MIDLNADNRREDAGKALFRTVIEDDNSERRIVSFIDENKAYHELTGHEYAQMVNALSTQIAKRTTDIPAGTWAALSVRVHQYWHAAFFGLLACGFNVLLLDRSFDHERAEACIDQAGVRLIVADTNLSFSEVTTLNFDELITDAAATAADDYTPLEDQPAWGGRLAYCTSGTTGSLSKLPVQDIGRITRSLCITRDTLLDNVEFVDGVCRGSLVGKRMLLTLPLHHNFGFLATLLFWMFESCICFYDTRSVLDIIDAVKKLKVFILPTVPLVWKTMYNIIIARHGEASPQAFSETFGSELGFGITGGAAMDPVIRKRLSDLGLSLCDVYGSSETPLVMLGIFSRSDVNRFGIRLSGYTTRILDEDGTPHERGIGELLIKGGMTYTGYLSDGKPLPVEVDADGFVRTGDVFELGEQDACLLGRCKNIIVNEDGENIYPEELEVKFNFLLSDADQYRVIGIDETPVLFVHARDEGPSEEELVEKIRDANNQLEIYKRVRRLYFSTDSMPSGLKGVLGKLLPDALGEHPEQFREIPLIGRKAS